MAPIDQNELVEQNSVKRQNWNAIQQWAQLIMSVFVVVGVVLVVWELRETKQMKRAELASEQIAGQMAFNSSLIGENPAPVWVKGCVNHESLTPSERVIYDRILNNLLALAVRPRHTETIANFGTPWKQIGAQWMRMYLGTPLGREYFEQFGANWHPDEAAFAAALIPSIPSSACLYWKPDERTIPEINVGSAVIPEIP